MSNPKFKVGDFVEYYGPPKWKYLNGTPGIITEVRINREYSLCKEYEVLWFSTGTYELEPGDKFSYYIEERLIEYQPKKKSRKDK